MQRTKIFAGSVLTVLTLSATPLAAQYPTEPPPPMALKPIQFPPFQEVTLDNGLTLLVVENHRLPIVSVSLSMLAGSRSDPAGVEGLAGMVADLLTKGTERRTAEQIAEEIESVGARLSANAGNDFFRIRTTVLTDHVELAFDLMSDVLLHSTFPDDELELTRKRALSGIQANKANAGYLATTFFNAALYGDHPYGRSETEESISAITLAAVEEYAATYLRPGGGLLVMAGDISLADARRLAAKYLGDWLGAPPPAEYPKAPAPKAAEIILVHRPGSVQSNIRMGNLALRPGADLYYSAVVMNKILGGGVDARLFMILREEKSWTYGAYSGIARRKDIGFFQANTEVRSPVTDSALVELIHQLDRMRSEAVPPEELEAAKGFLVGSFPLSIQTPQQIAGQVATVRLLGLGEDYLRTYHQRLDAVGAADVMLAAQQVVRTDSAVIVVVGDGKEIYDRLTAIAPVRIIDSDGNPLTPDDLAAPGAALAFDPSQLVEGTDSLQILIQGNPFGSMTRSVEHVTVDGAEAIVVSGILSLGGEMKTVLTLDPTSLRVRKVDIGGTQQGRDIEVHVTYGENGVVTGTVSVPQPGGEQREATIDTVLAETVLDDNVLQTLVHVMDLTVGETYSVAAFDANEGVVKQYTLSVSEGGSITVPAGTFETIKIDLAGGPFPFVLYVSKDAPRRLVKIELVGPPVVFELVK